MNALSVKEIVRIVEGELFCGREDVFCTSFTKDTREIHKGDTYIGIKGRSLMVICFTKRLFLVERCVSFWKEILL